MPADSFLAIAHRGASSYAPENTYTAFDLALEMGAADLELDVHLSRDGHLVVIHDEKLDRTTNASGAVAERTRAELETLDAGAWFGPAFAGQRIPAFTELLARYKGRARLHVEIKGRGEEISRRTVQAIREAGMGETVVTSFHKERLQEVRTLAPESMTGWLVKDVNEVVIAEAQALGITQFCPKAAVVTRELVEQLHERGFQVRAWGVSTEELMRHAVDAGVDGMTINFPDKLLDYLKDRRRDE